MSHDDGKKKVAALNQIYRQTRDKNAIQRLKNRHSAW